MESREPERKLTVKRNALVYILPGVSWAMVQGSCSGADAIRRRRGIRRAKRLLVYNSSSRVNQSSTEWKLTVAVGTWRTRRWHPVRHIGTVSVRAMDVRGGLLLTGFRADSAWRVDGVALRMRPSSRSAPRADVTFLAGSNHAVFTELQSRQTIVRYFLADKRFWRTFVKKPFFFLNNTKDWNVSNPRAELRS